MQSQQSNKGFTLIELLVVIAVIGLLSLLTVLALGQKREQMRDIERLSNLRDVQAHLELYFVNNNAYPVAPAPGKTLGAQDSSCLNNTGFAPTGCADAIMTNIPQDPGGFTYVYSSADGTTYTISAELEGEIEGFRGRLQATPSFIQQVGN